MHNDNYDSDINKTNVNNNINNNVNAQSKQLENYRSNRELEGMRQMQSNKPNSLQNRNSESNNANTKAIQNAADAASKSGNAYAKAIGSAVKAADKLTGGKASQALGKTLTKANKVVPGGRTAQRITNGLAKSKTADRIYNGLGKKNDNIAVNNQNNNSINTNLKKDEINTTNKHEAIDQSENEAATGFHIPYKAVITVAIAATPVFIVIVFIVLLISGPQIFLNSIGLGQADSVSDDEAQRKIDGIKDPSKFDNEIEDTAYIFDIYVDDENVDLLHYEFAKSSRPNQEANLDELKDFYPDIVNYTGDEYNQNDVYKFFTKLYCIYNQYRSEYKVRLDMSLIMSVLQLQSSDMKEVFKSNTLNYDPPDLGKIEESKECPYDSNFDVEKDWSSYKSTKNNSSHDIEVLAQAMVKEGGNSSEENSSSTSSFVSNNLAEAMVNLALKEYEEHKTETGGQKYVQSMGYPLGTAWCAIFVTWLSKNASYNNQTVHDIVPINTASVTEMAGYFLQSNNPNVKWHYNTLCSWYKGKYEDYTPKPGDIIIYYNTNTNCGGATNYLPDGCNRHTGIVEKYENGVIHTIEGNTYNEIIGYGDIGTIGKHELSGDNDICKLVGFGSWY